MFYLETGSSKRRYNPTKLRCPHEPKLTHDLIIKLIDQSLILQAFPVKMPLFIPLVSVYNAKKYYTVMFCRDTEFFSYIQRSIITVVLKIELH